MSEEAIVSEEITIAQSLYLIKVDNLNLYKKDAKNRVDFTYNAVNYDLPSTDPNFNQILAGYKQHTGHLCISLGELYKGHHYKIVATIL